VRAQAVKSAVAAPLTADTPDRSPSAIRFLIVALLAAVALMTTAERARTSDGVDFFNLWGVPAALRFTDHGLGNPYREGAEYLVALKGHSGGDARLAAAAEAWSAPDFTATPLLYAVFSTFSSDYTASLAVFRLVQIITFILACGLLGRAYGVGLIVMFSLALVMLLSYQPLLADLRVTNVGCLQFGLLSATVVASRRLLDTEDRTRRAAVGGLLFVFLGALTLTKPNVALVTGLLAVHLAVRLGRRLTALVSIPVAIVTIALIVAPCLYFESWRVWADWYQFVYGSNAHMLVRSVRDGNYSTVVLLSSWLDTDVFKTSLGLIGLLGASLLGATWWTSGTAGHSRSLTEAAARITRHVGASAEFALTLGIAATMAIAPLFWLHYFMLAVIPCIWLLATPFASRNPARLAILAMILSSAIPGMLLTGADDNGGMATTVAASWVPLWAAIIIIAAKEPLGRLMADANGQPPQLESGSMRS
jgi:hypothetical protein